MWFLEAQAEGAEGQSNSVDGTHMQPQIPRHIYNTDLDR